MLLAAAAVHGTAGASDAPRPGAQVALVDFSLEQLTDVVVTSVSRQETRLAETPASVYLISGADIRRAGATSLPEALRLAPNLQVARSDSRNWSITARGFNSGLENKLLVMIDGRSIYSPLFSGVFWDSQDVLMEDIDRIEVISGPGATIWGANAVNGVINIITRNAADTQGVFAAITSGNRGDSGAARFGGVLGNGGHYRVYAQYNQAEPTSNEPGQARSVDAGGWRRRQAGLRADWVGSVHDVTISADAYQGTLDGTTQPDLDQSGANLLARVSSRLADGSALRLQAYLDHIERNQPRVGAQVLDTLDLDGQHSVGIGAAQRLTWGGGVRLLRDRFNNSGVLQFFPAERSSRLGNVFAQDEITLRPALRLTAGLKLEHNGYTGWEVLPNLHLGMNLDDNNLLWTGLSRTVRAPSRIDRDLFIPTPRGPTPYSIAGGPDFVSETASVLEVGYRGQGSGPALAGLSYAATVFYSDYERLRTLEPGNPLGPQFRNMGRGEARGVELWARWQVRAGWRLSGGLVVQDVRTRLLPGSLDASGMSGLATNDPSNHWQLRSSHDLTDTVQADVALRHVGRLPSPAVPAYTEFDARLAWQPVNHVSLSLAGQNLLRAGHVEFGAPGTAQRVERAVAVKLALRF
ncbi:MAG: TonB-dependent receptor [Massilia sp.]|nr:TonB-dependent receptor [Massilia sp.]